MNADTQTTLAQAMPEQKMQCIQINTSEETSEKCFEFIVKLPHLAFKVSHRVTFSESHFFPLVASTEKQNHIILEFVGNFPRFFA